MCHGLDSRGLRGFELADQVDDLGETVLVDRNLGIGERKPCEMRDRVDLVAIEAHRKLKQKMLEMCAESYLLPCGACCRLLNCRHFFALRLVASCLNACAATSRAIFRSIWEQPIPLFMSVTRASCSMSRPLSRCRTTRAVVARSSSP